MTPKERAHNRKMLLSTRSFETRRISNAYERIGINGLNDRNTKRVLNLLERAATLTRNSSALEQAVYHFDKASERVEQRRITKTKKTV